MSTKTTTTTFCDECKATLKQSAVLPPCAVTATALNVLPFMRDADPLDFCDWDCLAKYATAEQRK